MDFNPSLNSSDGFNVERAGNACGIDFSRDTVFLPLMYSVFFLLGVPMNLFALFGLYRLIKTENVLPVYLINLLLSDLLQLLTLPLWINYYMRGHRWQFGPTVCHMMALIFYITIYASIFFMCAIALERYLAIARPLKFRAIRSLKCACWVALGLWVAVALPPIIAFKVISTGPGNSSLCFEKFPSEERFVTYRLIILVLSFFFPLGFIVALYRSTLRALTGVIFLFPREKRQIRGLLTLLVIIFILVLGPYHLAGSAKYLGLVFHPVPCQWEKAVYLPYQVGRVMLSVNSLLDPVFYIFLRSDFRDTARGYLPCLRRVPWFASQERSSERPTNSSLDSNQ